MIKSKLLSIVLITVILAVSMVTAANTFTVSPTTFEFIQPDNNLEFSIIPVDVNDDTNYFYEITQSSISQDNGQPILFDTSSVDGSGILNSIPMTATNIDYDKLSIGKDYTGTLTIKKCKLEEGIDELNGGCEENEADPSQIIYDNNDKQTISLNFIKSFCDAGEKPTYSKDTKDYELEITDISIDNSDGADDEWSPLDEIEIKVKVSNNGNERIKDVIAELGLFDSKGKNFARKKLDFTNKGDEKIDLGSIRKDDEDTATFTFKIPADLDADNYQLVIKAYSNDLDEKNICTSFSSDLSDDYYQSIDIVKEEDKDKHVILDNIKVSPTIAQCEETVQVTGEIVNIGDEDYFDQLKVTLEIRELGINLEEVVRKDLNQGDSKVVEFEFTIPPETTEKLYNMEFRTYYDYNGHDDTYDLVSDETFLSSFRVEGNCEVIQKSASITAELDAETPKAIPGKQVIINAELKNTGDVETTYTVSISGNSAWSDLVSLDPQIITLVPGATREVVIALDINEDASGDQEFKIRASFDAEMREQTVSLTISEEKQAELGPVVEHLKANWFIYLIILVNIILIIAIILVIRSMVAPRPM